MNDEDERQTLRFEDRRGNALICDLHLDRVTICVAAADKHDSMYTGWVHLTPTQARELARAIWQQWGESFMRPFDDLDAA